jgi:hypothetical protein
MKKFFKALALVLALVLVIGSLPVAAAEGDYSLANDKDNKKVIYIGGSIGESVDGKQCTSKNYYDFTKHVNNFDEETMDLKFDKISDDSIISLKDGSDRVYAKKIGLATVTIGVYDKETGKKKGEFDVKVQVKKNAEALNYAVFAGEVSPENLIVDPTQKFGVNTPYIVVLTRKDPTTGALVDTDQRILTCDNENVVIEPVNPYNTIYSVTFKAAGTYSIHAATRQSNKYDKEILSYDIPVVVGYDAENVAQSGLSTFDVTFKQPVSGLDKSAFKIYSKVSGKETQIPFSSIKEVKCAENVATVVMYNDFVYGTEYFVDYNGVNVGSFTAYSFDKNSVAAVVIDDQSVTVSTLTDIKFKLVDENGIDITGLRPSVLKGTLTFELVDKDGDAYISGSKVFIKTVGKTYTVKATYTWYDSSSADPRKAYGEGKVTCVAAPVWEIGEMTSIVSAYNAADYVKADGGINGDVKAYTWTMDNPVSGAALQIAVPYTKGNEKMTDTFATVGGKGLYDHYQAKSADETVVMIGKLDGQRLNLIANAVGECDIIVYGMPKGKTDVKEGTVLDVITVTVNPKREAKEFKVTYADNKNTLNRAYAADKVVLNLELIDQYNEKLPISGVSISKVAGEPVFDAAKCSIGSSIVIPYDAVSGNDGGLNLEVKCGNFTQPIFISVGNENKAATQTLVLSHTTIKTGVKADTSYNTDNMVEISLKGSTASGYDYAGDPIKFTSKRPEIGDAVSGAATGFMYTVSKGGSLIDASKLSANFLYTTDGTFNLFVPVTNFGAATDTAIKLEAGEYLVEAYNVYIDGTTLIPEFIGSASFTVEDDQLQPEVTVNDNKEKLAAITPETVASAFTVKFNGSADGFTKTFDYQVSGDGKSAYVKSVTITINNATVGGVTLTKAIDELVKVK